MRTLQFMGVEAPEAFRGRVYGSAGEDSAELQREAFVKALETTGVIDCPAYDPWVLALQDRGWLASEPELEPAPDGGHHGRWRLTPRGRAELRGLDRP